VGAGLSPLGECARAAQVTSDMRQCSQEISYEQAADWVIDIELDLLICPGHLAGRC
jgi:hypothetical protein